MVLGENSYLYFPRPLDAVLGKLRQHVKFLFRIVLTGPIEDLGTPTRAILVHSTP